MKALLLAILLTGCVTSKYITRYECDDKYRKFILTSSNRCIDSAGPLKIEECRSNAMKVMCTPRAYFKRSIFPMPGGETVEKPCSEASTLQEWWICQKGE